MFKVNGGKLDPRNSLQEVLLSDVGVRKPWSMKFRWKSLENTFLDGFFKEMMNLRS